MSPQAPRKKDGFCANELNEHRLFAFAFKSRPGSRAESYRKSPNCFGNILKSSQVGIGTRSRYQLSCLRSTIPKLHWVII